MQAIPTTPHQQQKPSSVVIIRNESMDSEYGPNCNCSIKNNGSPEMEMKRNKTLNSANNGLTKPTAKRMLHFEEEDEDEIEGISSSRDEAFRDLASVLRGVVALKRNLMAPSSSPPKQGMLSKPPHHIAKAKRRLRLGSLQHYTKTLGAQNSKECNRRTQTNRRDLKGLGKNLVHQTWNKFDKDISEELGNRAFFQKCSRISRREPEIAPVIRNFEMLREVLDNKRKMKRTSQKLNGLGNNLLRMPGIEPFNEHIWDFDENTSEQPADETIDQSSDKYSTNSAKTLRDQLCCDPKFEGICQTLKDLVKGSVQGPGNEPLDEDFKKSCEDRSEKPGNEVIDNSAKKYSRNSAKKRRNKPVSQAFDNSVGLGNQMICQNLQDLGNDIVQKLANEPVYKIMKKFNDDRSEELGNKECGSEPLSQVLEISCEVLREGICSDPRRNVNSQKLVNNSVQNPANVLFDKHLKQCNGAISQETGNEIIDRRFKKGSRGSVNKQRNEPASHVFKRFSTVLEEGLGSESKVERNNQNIQDFGKTLVQHPVSHPVEVYKYDKERSDELANDVIDQGFLKCSRSSTKEDGAEHVNQGFNKSCAVLQDGLGNEQKIQNFASSVGPKVKFHSNSDNLFSISPVTEDKGPYPDFIRPGSEECRNIRDRLLELHGYPEEFAKFRARLKEKVTVPLAARQQLLALDKKSGTENVKTEGNNEIVSCFDKKGYEIIPTVVAYEVQETMLDSLISTLLSQNTTDANSRRAFATLKERFPTWDEVYLAHPKAVEDAIRCGGLAETKASRIRNILDTLLKEQGKICLEHLRSMPVEKIKAELCRFKGIGPKTVACVLMFHLQQDDFPVDSHVYRITKSLGWVPAEADREKAYLHLNNRIPNDLKFDLNCLFVTHGKNCSSCSKRGRLRQATDGACPLKIGVTNN